MTKHEAITLLVPHTHNAVSEAIGWFVGIAVTCAVVAYIVIRANDKIWRKRIQHEGVK